MGIKEWLLEPLTPEEHVGLSMFFGILITLIWIADDYPDLLPYFIFLWICYLIFVIINYVYKKIIKK